MNPMVQLQCTCIGYLPKSATMSIVLFHMGGREEACIFCFVFYLCGFAPMEKRSFFFLLLLLSQSALLIFHKPYPFLWRKACMHGCFFSSWMCYRASFVHWRWSTSQLTLPQVCIGLNSEPSNLCSLVHEPCLSHWDFSQLFGHPIDTLVYCKKKK